MIKLRLWLVVIVALAGCGGGSTHRKPRRTPPPPPIAAKITTFKLGGEVWDVAPTRRVVWVTQRGEGRVLRLAPSGRRIGRPVRLSRHLGTYAYDLAQQGSDVWLAYSGNDGRIARLDPATGAPTAPIRVGRGVEKLALGAGAAYVSHFTSLARFPLAGGRARTVDLHRTPNALLFAGGELWATVSYRGLKGSILELNAKTLAKGNDFDAADFTETTTTADQAEPFGLTQGAGSVWAAVAADVGELVRFDLKAKREVARIHVGTPYPTAVAYARGAIWVLDYYANTLTRVDPKTNKVTGRLTVGPPRNHDDVADHLPAGLAVQGGNLWVTNADRGTVTRVTVP